MNPAPAETIVVLDGYTGNPGDLSWEPLKCLGECRIYDRTPRHQVRERSAEATLLLTNKAVVDAEVIQAAPRLRYIGVLATGYNVVDLAAAKDRGIVVTHIPAYSTPAVAQATIALLLELTNQVGHHHRTVQEGRWSRSPDFCYWDHPIVELAGLTLGIIGFGRIGEAVARIGQALGMKILAHRRTPPSPAPAEVEFTSIEDLARRSDVVSLHCPLSEATRALANATFLSWMKPGAFLLNTSRGPLVDEAALADALRDGRLGGAALDVLSAEPPPQNHPLIGLKNCIITPHIAWASQASRGRLMEIAAANIQSFLQGNPRNQVFG